MPSLPRLAIGTIQDGADSQAILVGLLDTLRRGGVQTQCFASRASLPGQWTPKAVTGLPERHLDSWLMSPELCCSYMLRSGSGADLAAVMGQFDRQPSGRITGGSLDTLCQWLSLPRLAVVNTSLIDQHGLPARPQVDAVLVDHASQRRSLAGMVTDIETLWGLPVVGALGNAESARRELAALAPGSTVPDELRRQLHASFLEHWRPERFAALVGKASPLQFPSLHGIHELPCRKPTIAVAYDEAFFGYFPSTLDQLELLGAQVIDFSPLRDESLPPGTEIVYLGCGRPEAFAAALSENHCMKSALRSHVARGGRIYGEVGGAAYLSQMIESPAGPPRQMCGILPAVARHQPGNAVPDPVELTIKQSNWLGPQGTRLRGYRSSLWRFEALGCRLNAHQKTCCQPDLIGCNCVVGSLIHFHFATFPEVFQSFFRPSAGRTPVLDPWQSAS